MMEGGFRHSPLRLNEGLGTLETWNETTILERAERLATQALKVWAAPSLPKEVLEAYRPRVDKTVSYAIEDHTPLVAGRPMRQLFDAFRTEVMALDPNITEEFFKIYIAYKAETNFVDVSPQTKQLLLTLNLPFPDIHDPKGLCKDMTGIGKHGNGDVQFGLRSLDDLPYAIGLVRQSLERQMGDVATSA